MANGEIVYLLTNEAMPGLLKIGMTGRGDVEARMKELFTTGVPVPFDCAYACKVANAAATESALHNAFGTFRVNPNREFFKLDSERVIPVLKLLQIEEITREFAEKLEAETTAADRDSAKRLKRTHRPVSRFSELGIPFGSKLCFRDRPDQVTVIDDRLVNHNGSVVSLTEATRRVLGREPGTPLRPGPFWTFEGRRLDEIYEDIHVDVAA
jgi:hypothetical protein